MKTIFASTEAYISTMISFETKIFDLKKSEEYLLVDTIAPLIKQNILREVKKAKHKKFLLLKSLDYIFEGEELPKDESVLFSFCREVNFNSRKNIFEFDETPKLIPVEVVEMKRNGLPITDKAIRVFASEISLETPFKVYFDKIKQVSKIGEVAMFFFSF